MTSTAADVRTDDRNVLAGLKVADFSTLMAGPYCTRLLADLGADVVKIESPIGDMIRTAAPVRDGRSSYWASLNVGKRSVVLDMKNPDGKEAGAALIGWADVVVENFRPGVMARFGLDYPKVSRDRPELVYCSLSGYGQSGPWVDRPANAQVIQATSGYDLATLSFQADATAPLSTGIFPADALGGALAFGAVLAAVRARDTTGTGRHIDLALLDGALSMMTYEVQNAQFPAGYDRRGYPPARTADGWVMIAALSDVHVRRLFTAIGRPECADDPRFATTVARWAHTTEVQAIVEEWTSVRTSAECEAVLNRAGVASSRYFTVEEVLASEQVRHRGSTIGAVDGSGTFQIANTPFQLSAPAGMSSATGAAEPLRAADPGAHTREVLAAVLGAEQAAAALASGGAYAAPLA
ncbi:MAG TPA: CoA transferase [Pseudonocardiaceae bacterium]|nr:CoA transferase [Pseudonocardiaceae bacterium]